MKKTIWVLAFTLTVLACKEKKEEKATEVEAPKVEEKTAEWVSLFNGNNLDGWRTYGEESVVGYWSVEEGSMKFTPPTERPNGKRYDIITNEEYTNFELSVDWKISEAGNSGIFWAVKETEKFGVPYATGPEIQVLDNQKHPDAKNGTDRQAGALYDMMSPTVDAVKPAGEWNTCVIKIDHEANKGEVSLNGVNILNFPVHGPDWDAMIVDSKFNGWDGFGAFKTGKICLQDHDDIVWYKNIKIKEL